ncbi:MAG: lipocalin-like domain-containing protein [Sphingobacteriales bacterium]|nr:lipocalin-like domain-containing protein [Sphingobacteriales bacterium]
MKKIILLCLILSAAVLISFYPVPAMKIDGAWKIVEVQTVKKDGSSTSTFPTESLAFFNKGYYTFCWTSQQGTPRTWQQTDSVKLTRMNQSIVNAGSYTLEGETLQTKALFALSPMFVNGTASFTCSFHGDTLVLSGNSVLSSDNIPNPLYAAGSHIVNKLVRIK